MDSETVPVADTLILGWYSGIGREAGRERWAFAFSAKREWRSKVKADVAKLVATDRGYNKAFFVTNQYVRDRDRANIEDDLSRKHGIDVRVLDLTWLLDKVFDNQLEVFAIETLRISKSLRPEIRRGPRDTEREHRLAELETSIQERLQTGRIIPELIADAVETAKIARELDQARTEVDGRFFRAKELADKLGSQHERLQSTYTWAWTTFWWYEDYVRYTTLVGEAFEVARGTENSFHLELLGNLWMCLRTAVYQFGLSAAEAQFKRCTANLLDALDRAGANEERPSNALYAQTLAIQTRLLLEPEDTDVLLRNLKSTIERAQPLIGYPFDTTAELVREMAPAFGHSTAYDELFESVVAIAGERKGDVTAARMLLGRGVQLLQKDQHLDALRYIGRGLGRLYKEESRDDLIRALYLAGYAYAEAGLLWAARGSFLNAASIATNDYHKYRKLTHRQVGCYERLKWIELELGRLPQALEWYELATIGAKALGKEEQEPSADLFDAIVGILFLKADVGSLRSLERLPDTLEEMGLSMSRSALLHSLGHVHELPKEVLASAGQDPEAFFMKWRDQPASGEIRALSLGIGDTTTLESDMLGCHVTVVHDNRPPAIEMAETVLAAMESFVSTCLNARLYTHEPLLRAFVKVSESAEAPFSFRFAEELGRPVFYITCRPFNPHSLTLDEQAGIKERLMNLVIEMFARIIFIPAENGVLEDLIREDRALQRALDFTGSFVTIGNILGKRPKTCIHQWVDVDTKLYALARSEKWDASQSGGMSEQAAVQAPAMDARLADDKRNDLPKAKKHTQVRTMSYIRIPLWNRAGWSGVLFITAEEDASEPPVMGLVFKNADAAVDIFTGLQEDLGEEDVQDELRVGIIRGISAKNSAWYRVVIGTELTALKASTNAQLTYAMMVSRVQAMTPSSPANLERFLANYERAGAYHLAAALMDEHGRLKGIGRIRVKKKKLHIRHAWEIGPNDPDLAGIREDDEPLIPADKKDIPVLRLKEQMTALRALRNKE